MKKWFWFCLAALLLALFPVAALAYDVPDTLLQIDMAGVNASLLVVGMSGVGDSRLIINWFRALPYAPTNFRLERIDDRNLNMTWTMGDLATHTMIRYSELGYPQNPSDGYEAYFGVATQATVEGLDLDRVTYYFRAWSWNAYGYSPDYAETTAGLPIGLPGIAFCVGLLGFALWKKDWLRMLLSICVMMWGAFAMPYDVKIAAPLVAAGAILFIIGITQAIRQRYEEAA